MVRKKNVLSVLMQVFATACVLALVWMVVGYSLAFGEGNAYVGDLSKAFLSGLTLDSFSGTIPESVFMMFQMTFFMITPALIVGGFVDRMKFSTDAGVHDPVVRDRLRADRALGLGLDRISVR